MALVAVAEAFVSLLIAMAEMRPAVVCAIQTY
jgi:hypothetical protein